MTLGEYLQSAPPDEVVYLGGYSGSAFMDINTADGLLKSLPELNASILTYLTNAKRTLVYELREFRALIGEQYSKAKIERITNSIADLSRRISNFTSALDLEVVDTYRRRWCPPLGQIVIVDCPVRGRYWLAEEKYGSALKKEETEEWNT